MTVAVKKGLSREAAILYPFEETRKALYDGAQRAVGAIARCKPFKLKMPIKARVQYISSKRNETKLVTREGRVDNASNILMVAYPPI